MSTILQTVMPSSVDQSEQHEAKPDMSRGVTTVTKHFFAKSPGCVIIDLWFSLQPLLALETPAFSYQ